MKQKFFRSFFVLSKGCSTCKDLGLKVSWIEFLKIKNEELRSLLALTSHLSYLTKLFKVSFDLFVWEFSLQLAHVHFALLRLRLLHCHLGTEVDQKRNVENKISQTFLPFTVCSSDATASFNPSTVLNTTNANPLQERSYQYVPQDRVKYFSHLERPVAGSVFRFMLSSSPKDWKWAEMSSCFASWNTEIKGWFDLEEFLMPGVVTKPGWR